MIYCDVFSPTGWTEQPSMPLRLTPRTSTTPRVWMTACSSCAILPPALATCQALRTLTTREEWPHFVFLFCFVLFLGEGVFYMPSKLANIFLLLFSIISMFYHLLPLIFPPFVSFFSSDCTLPI